MVPPHAHTTHTDGFTLVEMIVTVVIIGILLTMAMGLFQNSTDKANVKSCETNKEDINVAMARAAATMGAPLSSISTFDTTAKQDAVNRYLDVPLGEITCNAKGHTKTYTARTLGTKTLSDGSLCNYISFTGH